MSSTISVSFIAKADLWKSEQKIFFYKNFLIF